MKIGITIKHDESLQILKDAGVNPPRIPKGKNTSWKHFKTVDGLQALVVNQSGGVPTAQDNEEEVNGLSVLVAIDAPDIATAQATLEREVIRMLELDAPPSDGRGRPSGEEMDAVIRLRLPMREKNEWVRAARDSGQSLSEWIRSTCNAR